MHPALKSAIKEGFWYVHVNTWWEPYWGQLYYSLYLLPLPSPLSLFPSFAIYPYFLPLPFIFTFYLCPLPLSFIFTITFAFYLYLLSFTFYLLPIPLSFTFSYTFSLSLCLLPLPFIYSLKSTL